jgi:hypothetical protein
MNFIINYLWHNINTCSEIVVCFLEHMRSNSYGDCWWSLTHISNHQLTQNMLKINTRLRIRTYN